jgi:hypothetical protein
MLDFWTFSLKQLQDERRVLRRELEDVLRQVPQIHRKGSHYISLPVY